MQSKPIRFYENEFYMFSNFSSFAVEWEDMFWMTSEHVYQAAKFREKDIRQEIQSALSAHDAKKVASIYIDSVRSDWSEVKLSIMESIVRAKLEQHAYIQKKLLESGDRIIEENSPVDSYWGTGPDEMGQNHLGKIWMKLREELKTEKL